MGVLTSGPPSKTAPAKLLAEESLLDGIPLEKALPWSCDLSTETCNLSAQFHGCCDSFGNGSVLRSPYSGGIRGRVDTAGRAARCLNEIEMGNGHPRPQWATKRQKQACAEKEDPGLAIFLMSGLQLCE